MTELPVSSNPETLQTLQDDARKFTTDAINPEFLRGSDATSFTMRTDWLVTDEDSETKLAYKEFDSGAVDILLISKHTEGDKRTSRKEKITPETYSTLLESSVLSLNKRRHEFNYVQNGITFSVKVDEFDDNKLNMVEIDSSSDTDRDLFDPSDFPLKLNEVTGNLNYYGYRIARII